MTWFFVNFRNGGDDIAAALLYDTLASRFGVDKVFRSSDSLLPGEDFAESMLAALERCAVVLVVIGRQWLRVTDRHGRRRLDQRTDWVRKEIAFALSRGKTVIPILLHGHPRLGSQELPPSIRQLARLQSCVLDHRRLRAGLDALVASLAQRVPDGSDAEPAPAALTRVPARLWGAVPRPGPLDRLEAAVGDARGSVTVLCGAPGTGKTQLAVEYAHRCADVHHATWWLSGERPELVNEQLGELARAVGCDARDGSRRLFAELAGRGRWLLVLDGVDDPMTVTPLLAAGPDRVLITSRERRWALPAVTVEVPGFTRDESVRLLGGRLPELGPDVAHELADVLDDLPLAVAQAASFLGGSTVDAGAYRDLLRTRTASALDRGAPLMYPSTLAGVWSLSMSALGDRSPAAAELAGLCAFFAAAPIPVDLFDAAAGLLSELRDVATDRLALDDAAAAVALSGLVELRTGNLRPHRLFQAYLRDRMTVDEAAGVRETARRVVAARHPGDPRSPESWPRYALLLPHILELDLVLAGDPTCHRLVLDASHYLVVVGDAHTARDLMAAAVDHWTDSLGDGHETVTEATSHLARAHFQLGDHERALELDERVLARRRRTVGPDDPRTLAAEHDVAAGRWALSHPQSRHLHEDVLRRRRGLLGEDHPDTLRTAHNLAVHLRASRSVAEALTLDEDTLARFRRVLGPDHPDTLRSAHSLAVDLRLAGRADEALALNEDTLARFRRVMGADHLETLRCANNLVLDRRATGAEAEADELDSDNRARLGRLPGRSASRP